MKIISYNIQSFGKDKYKTVQDLLEVCDLLLLQEVWKFEHEFNNIIKSDFQGFECVFTSPMDEKVPLTGRPYGGVGILYRANSNFTVEKIVCISTRLCIIKINTDKSSLMLFNVYMPYDTWRPGEEMDEFNEVLGEIKTIISNYSPQNVIIAGDLNVDMSRDNLHARALESFVTNENLYMCIDNSVAVVPYTRCLNQSFSTIDHYIVSNNLSKDIYKYETMFMHNDFSDHFPLYLELKLEVSYVNVPNVNVQSKTNWHKSNGDNIHNYKKYIENELINIKFDHDAITCRNLDCKKHFDYLNYLYKNVIEICLRASDTYIPTSSNNKKSKVVPGWNDYVQPYFEKSLFWHDIWVQNGRPREGDLALKMRQARARYHYAVKNVIKNDNKIRNDKMAEAISLNKDCDLWYEVKKMNKSSQYYSNIIDDQVGSENIVNLFYNNNKELFNSVGYDEGNMSNLKHKIASIVKNSTVDDVTFNVQDVKDVVNNLKNGKKEESGIFTDHFINGPDRLFIILSIIFNSMLVHGIAPSELLVGTMIPIVKDYRKSRKQSDNYRTLTLGTVLSKVFDLLILKKHNSFFNTSDLQYGFKENSSTVMSAFMVNQTISHYLSNGSNVNVLLLDASKAFDKIDFIKLFEKLLKRGLSPIIIRLILNMYISQQIQVKWNGVFSDLFDVSNGVRQGGVMSPLLFGIYIDDLLLELKRKGIGCHVGHIFCGSFGYADDIILLCPSISGLKEMIKICELYAKIHNITFNGTKSKLLIFGKKCVNPNITVNGNLVKLCIKADYLGILLNTENSFNVVDEGIMAFNVGFNRFLSKFNTCRVSVKNKLFNQYCCSYYGSQLWPLWDQNFDNVCVQWRKAIRRIWNLPNRTHCNMLPIIADAFPIEIILECKFINFCKSLLNSGNESVIYMANTMKANCQSTYGHNIRHLYLKYNLNYEDYFKMSKIEIKNTLYRRWLGHINDEYMHLAVMARELTLMKEGYFLNIFKPDEQNNLDELIEHACTS